MRKRKQAKSNKISKFGVWEWDDWTRDIPTLICDSIDNHGVFFAELIPSWPNDVNDRGEYEWDGSFDPETEPTNWTLEIYDTEFGEEGWTEVYGTAREAMEEADDFIAEFITEQNLIGNGPYTLAKRNAVRKRAMFGTVDDYMEHIRYKYDGCKNAVQTAAGSFPAGSDERFMIAEIWDYVISIAEDAEVLARELGYNGPSVF